MKRSAVVVVAKRGGVRSSFSFVTFNTPVVMVHDQCFVTTVDSFSRTYSRQPTTREHVFACRAPNSRARGVATAMAHSTSAAPSSSSGISLLNAEDSAALDVDLMQTPGFSIDQVAESLVEVFGSVTREGDYLCLPVGTVVLFRSTLVGGIADTRVSGVSTLECFVRRMIVVTRPVDVGCMS